MKIDCVSYYTVNGKVLVFKSPWCGLYSLLFDMAHKQNVVLLLLMQLNQWWSWVLTKWGMQRVSPLPITPTPEHGVCRTQPPTVLGTTGRKSHNKVRCGCLSCMLLKDLSRLFTVVFHYGQVLLSKHWWLRSVYDFCKSYLKSWCIDIIAHPNSNERQL